MPLKPFGVITVSDKDRERIGADTMNDDSSTLLQEIIRKTTAGAPMENLSIDEGPDYEDANPIP